MSTAVYSDLEVTGAPARPVRWCECCAAIRENGRPRRRPAVARWVGPNGFPTLLCRSCLDIWFDQADDDDALEPLRWEWLR
ncbi:hypothetical protein [Streptomyces sp. DH37]|uniref:hypothetical protein n=1 Tax=Streptomyces sp. DH37 TaxID=3040122 RepID=UPI0024429A10|nr:hypothetical protein [Streptomyces sp. DH37]MDG9703770.1 hypothetical protein [Streptomyces sp. DH37]